MPDLPQIVIPAVLFNVIICALASAASWHFASIVQTAVKKVRSR